MATVAASGWFVLGSKFAGVIEGISFFGTFVAILAADRSFHLFMAVDAVPVQCRLETWLVKMVCFGIFFSDCGCSERIGQMTSSAGYDLCLAAVTVAPDTVGILLHRSGGMMVTV